MNKELRKKQINEEILFHQEELQRIKNTLREKDNDERFIGLLGFFFDANNLALAELDIELRKLNEKF